MRMKIAISVITSVLLLICGYFLNNSPLFTGESLEAYCIAETANELFGKRISSDSAFFINTSYDKELIPCYNKEDSLGNTGITSRKTLYSLLSLLKHVEYKYLILDIRFMDGLHSPSKIYDNEVGDSVSVDKRLFDLIKSMDRIVVATHHNMKLIDKDLEQKAALADYRTTATATNFVRYEYFDSIPYIPLKVYNDIRKSSGDTIVCHYPFGMKSLKPFAIYTQGKKLCYNSLFLPFDRGKEDTGFSNELSTSYPIAECKFLNMGSEIINQPAELRESTDDIIRELRQNCKGRYVYIGNMTEDMHDTYAGPQPGPVILHKAINALDKDMHILSFWHILLLGVVYMITFFFILSSKNLLDYIPYLKLHISDIWRCLFDMVSFTAVFFFFHVIEYYYDKSSFSFVLPMIVFSITKAYIQIKSNYKMKNKIFVIIVALLSGLFLSFKYNDNSNRYSFKVMSVSSSGVRVNGAPVKLGMIITEKDNIHLPDPDDYIRLKNVGIRMQYRSKIYNEERWWEPDVRMEFNREDFRNSGDLLWWLSYQRTSTKGSQNVEEDFRCNPGECRYLIGDWLLFEIENPIINPRGHDQYYKFTVTEGRYKNQSIIALNDDTDSVVWITRKMLSKFNVKKNDILIFKVEYINFGDTIDITKQHRCVIKIK